MVDNNVHGTETEPAHDMDKPSAPFRNTPGPEKYDCQDAELILTPCRQESEDTPTVSESDVEVGGKWEDRSKLDAYD